MGHTQLKTEFNLTLEKNKHLNQQLKTIQARSLKILFLYFFLHFSLTGSSQIILLNQDRENSKSAFFEISLHKKLKNNQHEFRRVEKYYDFGFNILLARYQVNNFYAVDLVPFIDNHVVDNYGYTKTGFRIASNFKLNQNFQLIIAPGLSILNVFYENSGVTIPRIRDNGFSNEFSILFKNSIAFNTRLDVSKTASGDREWDFGLGVKMRANRNFGNVLVPVTGVSGTLLAILQNFTL